MFRTFVIREQETVFLEREVLCGSTQWSKDHIPLLFQFYLCEGIVVMLVILSYVYQARL